MSPKKKKPRKEVFLVLNSEGESQGYFGTYDLAESHVYKNEMDQARILRVVQAWDTYYPEEPGPEIDEVPLGNL